MTMLEVKGLTKYFGGLGAVKDLDFDIKKREIVGMIGPNGAGKTTVFNLLTGFHRPSKGKVIFKGCDITGLRPNKIAALGLARTFQIVDLFKEYTTFENVLLGHYLQQTRGGWGSVFRTRSSRTEEKELQQKTIELLERMELIDVKDEIASSLPQGLQRTLGISVALATNPDLLLLDEPTAGMSAEESGKIMALIKRVRTQGITIMVVEHDLKVVMSICDRTLVLDFGEKIADGTPEEIQSDEKVIQAYLGHKGGR